MNFHCIADPKKDLPLIYFFQDACTAEGVEFKLHSPANFDFTQPNIAKDGDAIYRISTGNWPSWPARSVEQHLISQANLATFYKNPNQVFSFRLCSMAPLKRKGLSVPHTIANITRNREKLNCYVEYCGGFPVVLKVPGNSRGIGILYADSFPVLYSITDYLLHQDANIIMQEFIPTTQSARLVVLNNEVIAGIEYQSEPRDFRSNVGKNKTVKSKAFSPEIQRLAVNAANVLDLEFGGVDILISPDGKPYVIEVNFPCRFIRTQQFTENNIARLMVKQLVQKSLAIASQTPWHAELSH